MSYRNYIKREYFEWMLDEIKASNYTGQFAYSKLLEYLHTLEFVSILPRDENRAKDGIYLRYRFEYFNHHATPIELYLDGPCSILEMMVALAIDCEESIMDDPAIGNRTGQWFWNMITSLGLNTMNDRDFDKNFVDRVIDTFLKREYSPDGRGGLFTIKNCDRDMRTIEIWYQLCQYLNHIT